MCVLGQLFGLGTGWNIAVITAHGHPEANLEEFTTSVQTNIKFNSQGYTMEKSDGLKPGTPPVRQAYLNTGY